MPTYEYRCPEGHTFERFQRISEDPVADCPDCGAAAERMISGGAGFLFKGDGFYITDYRSEEYKKKAAREKPSEGGSDGGSGGGADAPAKSESSGSSGSGDAGSGSSSTASSSSKD
jgi:putative FmdB family regulatory protein